MKNTNDFLERSDLCEGHQPRIENAFFDRKNCDICKLLSIKDKKEKFNVSNLIATEQKFFMKDQRLLELYKHLLKTDKHHAKTFYDFCFLFTEFTDGKSVHDLIMDHSFFEDVANDVVKASGQALSILSKKGLLK